MPSFHGAGIRAHLAATPLAGTLTPRIELRKGDAASTQAQDAERKLRESEFLEEETVPFPGDEEGFAVNWLGDAPFLQVLAGKDLWDADKKEAVKRKRELAKIGRELDGEPGWRSARRTTRAHPLSETQTIASDVSKGRESNAPSEGRRVSGPSTRAHPQNSMSTIDPAQLQMTASAESTTQDPTLSPQALVLQVMLSSKTFYESFTDGTPQHLMIDVFFNGQLSSCVLIHQADIRSGAKSLHMIFAGTRVDYLIERPWVILPPGQNSDGTLGTTRKGTSVQRRWQHICAELLKDANERGVNRWGERPPSGQFLKELATMKMPERVKTMQKPGGRTFGVVDVIVTVGTGKKVTTGTSYCLKPMRLVDGRYSYEAIHDLDKEGEAGNSGRLREEQVLAKAVKSLEESATDVDTPKPAFADQDAEGDSDPEYMPETSPSVPTKQAPSDLPRPPAFHNPFTGANIPSLPPKQGPPLPVPPLSSSTPSSSSGLPYEQEGPQELERRVSGLVAPAGENQAPTSPWSARTNYPSAHAPSTTPGNFCSLPILGSPLREDGHSFQGGSLPSSWTSHASAHTPPAALHGRPPIPNQDRHFGLNQYGDQGIGNPYRLPYADMLGFGSFGDLSSSPFTGGYPSPNNIPHFNPQSTDAMQGVDASNIPYTSTPFPPPNFLPPSQPRRVSFSHANFTSYNPGAAPSETPPTMNLPGREFLGPPSAAFNSSPVYQRSLGSFGPGPFIRSPYLGLPNRPPLGPPPPVGLYQATQKPKTSLPIDPGLLSLDQSRSSMLVRRLSITGRHGASIVDHRWETPQRIPLKRKRRSTNPSPSRSRSPTKMRRESPGSAEYVGPSSEGRHRSKTINKPIAPPPTSPSKKVNSDITTSVDRTKRDSVHDGQIVQNLLKVPTNGPALTIHALNKIPGPSQNTNVEDARRPTAVAPQTTGTSRRSTSTGILGIQGPKAATFVYDDPEVVIREHAKARRSSRSVSPTKNDVAPTSSVSTAPTGMSEKVHLSTMELDTGSSSPLSSVFSTPDSQAADKNTPHEKVTILSLLPDGASDERPSVTLKSTSGFEGRLANLASTSQLPPPMLPDPMNEPPVFAKSTTTLSPVRKKRNPLQPTRLGAFGSRIRTPRSPDRLSAKTNPPLNQDCVIAYAVSTEERGALRQIRGERQGLFAEESVVVGMRFFIAG